MSSAPPSQSPPPLSDSPLFWLLLFGGTAMFAVALIQPKFAQREARIERMYEARQKVAERQRGREAGQGSAAAESSADDLEAATDSGEPIVSLRSLMLVLATILVAGSLAYALPRRSPPAEASQ